MSSPDSRPLFALPAPQGPADPGTGEPPAVPEPLPDGATVDLAAERAAAGVDEMIEALDRDLVGLRPVKTRVAEIASLLLIDRVRARFGLPAGPPSLHMCFTATRAPVRPRWRCGWPGSCTGWATCGAAASSR